jgi:Cysteine-rich secretory protein family
VLLTDPATTGRHRVLRRAVVRRAVVRRAALRRTLAVVGAMTASVVLITGQAAASSNPGADFVAATNHARAAAGLPALSVSADLTAAATHQARDMADADALFHTPNLGSDLCCWEMVGENVGDGPSVPIIQAAFMASPEHRANILRAAFSQVGIGYVIDAHGTLWVSEVFRRPSGSKAPTAPTRPTVPVAPKVTKEPKATPRPVVTATPRRPAIKVHLQRPPLTAVGAIAVVSVVPAGQVSRSLARLPLAEAERLSVQFGVGEQAVAGTDPVSRLLDFAAKAAGSD